MLRSRGTPRSDRELTRAARPKETGMDGNNTPTVFVNLCATRERALSARWNGQRFAAVPPIVQYSASEGGLVGFAR